jgi:hypothetical protein
MRACSTELGLLFHCEHAYAAVRMNATQFHYTARPATLTVLKKQIRVNRHPYSALVRRIDTAHQPEKH